MNLTLLLCEIKLGVVESALPNVFELPDPPPDFDPAAHPIIATHFFGLSSANVHRLYLVRYVPDLGASTLFNLSKASSQVTERESISPRDTAKCEWREA